MGTRDRHTLANSFPVREVHALLELHACVLRGGDAKQIAASPPVCSVVRKFRAMARKAAIIDAPIDPGPGDAA